MMMKLRNIATLMLLIQFLVFSLSAQASSNKRITWSPANLTIELTPGGQQTYSVLLSANKTINKAALYVTSELSALIHAESEYLRYLRKHSRVEIKLQASVPADATPGRLIKGVLRISFKRHDSKLQHHEDDDDDGCCSLPITVKILGVQNHLPVANAGLDQSLAVGISTVLDGGGSNDADGDPLSYFWTFLQTPAGSNAQLSEPTAINPGFQIDKPGAYEAQLIVNDGHGDSFPDTVTISTVNSKPVADAGSDRSGPVLYPVSLDASHSTDADGDPLSYLWSLVQKPAGSNAVLTGETGINPSLTPDKPGDYIAQLTVNDGQQDSDPDAVTVSTVNSKPVADAGADKDSIVGKSILLDAAGSSDVDGDPLTYRWSLLTKPSGSNSILSSDDQRQCTFVPDQTGDYIAQLIVNDGALDSVPDTAQVTVSVPPPPPNRDPQMTSTAPITATVGQQYSYTVQALDPDGDMLHYSLLISPPGMSIDTVSGLIEWIPAQSGSAAVSVKAEDGKGGAAMQSFEISVDAATVQNTQVPNFIGQSRSAVEAAIITAKLNEAAPLFRHDPVAEGLVIDQAPPAGQNVPIGTAVTLTVSLGPDTGLPPKPETVAPKLDPTVATSTYAATTFLYSGDHPIQTGVAPGTIDVKRAAVIRGKALDKQNNPLPGVTITVLNHPEFGQTRTRDNGQFDLAVNGGGLLTVDYQKDGYLPMQRQVNAPWQDYVFAEDAVLIQQDAKVSRINLNDTTQVFQVAQGSPVSDADGTRQATLLIPQGTQAQVYNPDGTTRQVTGLNLRLTEYTVGTNGPESMPAPLPPASTYTYAVELRAEEATVKISGKDVLFDRSVPFYVDNFLNMPVGIQVPVAYWDKDKNAWIPSDDGKVIKILSVSNGLADIDSDGDDIADDSTKLAALELSEVERAQLAFYPSGKTLWRALLNHLSTYDLNYGIVPQAGAVHPQLPSAQDGDKNKPDDPTCVKGSIIECEAQTLSETISVTGTPFRFHYASDRASGRKTSNRLAIPLSSKVVPSVLKRIDLKIIATGRLFKQSFLAQPDQNQTFEWDGLDAYGRPATGGASLTVYIGYVYDGYYALPPTISRSFGSVSSRRIPGNVPARQEVTLWQTQKYVLDNGWQNATAGLGGWSLDIHHYYDPNAKKLYFGDGRRHTLMGSVSTKIIKTVAGTGVQGYLGDNGLATNARLSYPAGIAWAPDGSLYIAEPYNGVVRRIKPDGTIARVAGSGTLGFSGDGGLATKARLNLPYGLAWASDGSLYITDLGNHRVRRVGPDGIISTVAGTGTVGSSGDGSLATNARLNIPYGIASTSDNSLYITEWGGHRVRRVGPDGVISTVAGNGTSGFSGDDGLATEASLSIPSAVTLGYDGALYIADLGNNRIRRVGVDGIIDTVAGAGAPGWSGDGGPAAEALLNGPIGLAWGNDGALYIADSNNYIVRRIGSDGIITAAAGNGEWGFGGEGGSSTGALLSTLNGIAWGDGSLYIADYSNHRIRRVVSALPGVNYMDIVLPSEDAVELYHFDAVGRHLRTMNAYTGVTIQRFDYDTDGRLINIVDADNSITKIERDPLGRPTAIVAPFGQRTELALDTNGYLASVKNPASEIYAMTYTTDGLLTHFQTPHGHVATMVYDDLGRLVKDHDAAGGVQTLARNERQLGYQVDRTTGEGRKTIYTLETLTSSDRQRGVTGPDGTVIQMLEKTNGTKQTTAPDGSVSTVLKGPDPRFGMLAPVPSSATLQTGDLTLTTTVQRTATLSDPNNPLSLVTLTDTVTRNGRISKQVYDAATRTATATSAAGRSTTVTLDAVGRPIVAHIPGVEAMQNVYDTYGHLIETLQGSGTDERKTTFAYGTDGWLSSITDPMDRAASYEYDAVGRITRQIFPDGRDILYEYDADGNLSRLSPPGRPGHAFTYTPIGQTETYAPPPVTGGGDTIYAYNFDRQLKHVIRPDGKQIEFVYNAASGKLDAIRKPDGGIAYTYDAATGKLKTLTLTDGSALDFTYNGALLSQTAWSGNVAGNVGYSYDNDFRVKEIRVNGADPIAYGYDTDSLLTQAGVLTINRNLQNSLLTGTTLETVSDSYDYNNFGETATYQVSVGTNAFAKWTYQRDKLGRITQKTEAVNGVSHTFEYAYDLAGRLNEVKKEGVVTANYGYDANGNRTQINGQTIAEYDDQDRLLSYKGYFYTYTENGELSTKSTNTQTTRYDYDVFGNLKQVVLADGTQIDYVIDGQNRRIGKKVNGVLVQGFLYQNQLDPIAELDGNGSVVARFIYGDKGNVPSYVIKGGQTYRIVSDHLGSPRWVINTADGSIVQQLEYDVWGKVIDDTNPGFQPFGFAGGLYDRDTKLVRFGARDYEAETGRWTAKDPIRFSGNDSNLYGYVVNDPVNYIDYNGLIIGKVVSAVARLLKQPFDVSNMIGEIVDTAEGVFLENSDFKNSTPCELVPVMNAIQVIDGFYSGKLGVLLSGLGAEFLGIPLIGAGSYLATSALMDQVGSSFGFYPGIYLYELINS